MRRLGIKDTGDQPMTEEISSRFACTRTFWDVFLRWGHDGGVSGIDNFGLTVDSRSFVQIQHGNLAPPAYGR